MPSPEIVIEPHIQYLWDWYIDLSSCLTRVRNGLCEAIPPSEYNAWAILTGNLVRPGEFEIMRAMDVAFCAEMNKELADYIERQREASAQAANAPKPGGKRR